MSANTLESVAKAMVAPGKGILAADESTGTIEKRLAGIKVENTEENRRAYRDMLFSARGLGQYISGVIFYDETLRQKSADGTPFTELLARGVVQRGDTIVLTIGEPFGKAGGTNTMKIVKVGEHRKA